MANDSKNSNSKDVVKINLAFKPAGMSDAVYYLGKWVSPKQSPDDVVVRVSPPYRDRPFHD
ncbi:MAG: hypothetical protein P4L53_26975 [Candidatus Obscuribacterales bacterium]|nr:hypothetical protein [Candidatus Obscuribacterales bacterium]